MSKIGAAAVALLALASTCVFFIAYETDYYIKEAFAKELKTYVMSSDKLKARSIIISGRETLEDLKKRDARCCYQKVTFRDLNGNITYGPMIAVVLQNESDDSAYLFDIFGNLKGSSGYSRSEGERRRKPFH